MEKKNKSSKIGGTPENLGKEYIGENMGRWFESVRKKEGI